MIIFHLLKLFVKASSRHPQFLLLIALLIPLLLRGQDVQFRHYHSDEGFSGSAFKRIAQDSLGYLWITSGSGVFKFDGYKFTNYHKVLRNAVCNVDPGGVFWIGTEGQLMRFNAQRQAFDSIMLPLSFIVPASLGFSNEKMVWIGTNEYGLLSFERGADSVFSIQNTADPKARSIFHIVNEGNNLLLGTSHGLWRFDPEKGIYSRPFFSEGIQPLLDSGTVKKIFAHAGFYWLWINNQLMKIRPNGVVVNTLDFNELRRQFDPENKFSRAEVTCIAEAQHEKFWITTSGFGLIFYDPSTGKCRNYRYDKNDDTSPPSDVLNDVVLDRDDNVWFTTVNKGIVKIKKRSLEFYNYIKGFSSTGIEEIRTVEGHDLIVATNGGGLWKAKYDMADINKLDFQPFKFESSSGFENILEMDVGRSTLWLGSLNSGVVGLPVSKEGIVGHNPKFRFRHIDGDANSLSDNFITSLWESSEKYLWIGTYTGGINIASIASSPVSFNVYKNEPGNLQSIRTNGMRAFHGQSDGSVLVATFAGLDRIPNAKEPYSDLKFQHLGFATNMTEVTRTPRGSYVISSVDGLAEAFPEGESFRFEKIPLPGKPNVVTTQIDLLGRIWCMSFEGLFFYDPNTKFVLRFIQEDGLLSSRSVSAGRSAQTEDGVMLFSNAEGVTVFNPLTLEIDRAKPKPILTELRINNQLISPGNKDTDYVMSESITTVDKLELKHTHYILEIEFSAMDMSFPEKNHYKYKLKGFNDTWVETDWRNRKATYTNLNPGTYTFMVVASNRDGVMSDHVASIDIVVLPAPWRTWWAYSIYGLIIFGILYVSRRSILKEERLKASLRIEQVELEKKQMELIKAQEVDKLKSSFFTNISHEFRTPLTLIQGPVQQLLEKFADDPKIKQSLQLVQNNVDLLLKLINQLLELSRLESGNLTIDHTKTDLNAFIRSAVNFFNSSARQKNLSISVDLPSVPYTINVDNGKLETILINLLGNAMKFTPDNGKISLKAWFEGDIAMAAGKTSTLCVSVTDTGIGIPEDKQALIFDRFYQVSETHSQIGTGIGLALVRELTEVLKGSIEVRSKLGEGSVFALKIPVQVLGSGSETPSELITQVNNDLSGIESNGVHDNQFKVSKILVVEDNHDLRQFIISSFDGAYHCLEASTGTEGLDKAIHEIPELIISDIMMPEMDGIAMSAKIKRDLRTCHIPILFLTARATEKSKLEGLEVGAEDYLTKPFNKQELVLKVRNIIAARERIREKLRLELLKEAPSVIAQSADEQFLIKVKEVIHQRLNDPQLGVETLCLDVGMSRTQLYRKINALTGFGVNELIRTFRLKRAAQLLNQHWGSVSDIAYEVGFSNLSYFSKCFKEEFGTLPSEYGHTNTPKSP